MQLKPQLYNQKYTYRRGFLRSRFPIFLFSLFSSIKKYFTKHSTQMTCKWIERWRVNELHWFQIHKPEKTNKKSPHWKIYVQLTAQFQPWNRPHKTAFKIWKCWWHCISRDINSAPAKKHICYVGMLDFPLEYLIRSRPPTYEVLDPIAWKYRRTTPSIEKLLPIGIYECDQ